MNWTPTKTHEQDAWTGSLNSAKEASRVVFIRTRDVRATLKTLEQKKPDIVIIDLELGGNERFTLIRKIHKTYPTIKIIILASYYNLSTVQSAFKAGVQGQAISTSDFRSLNHAIQAVMEGKKYLCSEAATVLSTDYQLQLSHTNSKLPFT